MKFRPYAVVAALAAATLSLTAMPAAQADPADPVAGLSVTQTQVGHSLRLTTTWTANPDATRYRTYVTDQSNGVGDVLVFKDTAAPTSVITTDALASGQQYYVVVKAIAPAYGAVASKEFTASTLDETGPTGTYSLDRTSGFLLYDEESEEDDATARFVVTQVTQGDNTPGTEITRTIEAGDGTPAQPWTSGTFTLSYTHSGVYTPKVHLTDEFGNSTVVPLQQITVVEDKAGPVVKIKVPANPTKIASWQRISGTATDAGSGVQVVLAFIVQKRGKIWYAYDFDSDRWLKGYTSQTKTMEESDASPAFMLPKSNGTWITPKVIGLQKGLTHIEAVAFDNAFNIGQAKAVNPTLH